MIEPRQLLNHVVRPTLAQLEIDGDTAEKLVMGTIAHESKLGTYLKQIQGPALGICQMEPPTHDDIWHNWLRYRPALTEQLLKFVPMWAMEGKTEPDARLLITSLEYAVAMCRIHYLRVPHPLPDPDATSLAWYWKEHFNTSRGRGTPQQFSEAFASIAYIWE